MDLLHDLHDAPLCRESVRIIKAKNQVQVEGKLIQNYLLIWTQSQDMCQE
jgi:hypothetical protein